MITPTRTNQYFPRRISNESRRGSERTAFDVARTDCGLSERLSATAAGSLKRMGSEASRLAGSGEMIGGAWIGATLLARISTGDLTSALTVCGTMGICGGMGG